MRSRDPAVSTDVPAREAITPQSVPAGCKVTGFLLAFKVCLAFLFFQSNPHGGAAATVALTLGWLLVVAGYTILDPPERERRQVSVSALRWIMVYLGLAAVSLLWTTTNSPSVAAGYWAATAADVVAIWLLLRYQPVEQNAVRIMQGFIVGAATVAIVAWSAPAMEDMRLGQEDFLHPNLIGFEFAIAALFSAHLAQHKKAWTWAAAGFAVTMVRTLSKGTIVGFLFAGLYYLLRGLKISRKARIYVGVASTAVLMCFWGLLEAYFDLYTEGSNLETLTGRTYIWTQSLDLAMDKPWFGHGFDSFRWVFPPFENFQPWHAHNELIQQLFAYGLVGILIVVGVYWAFYRQVRISRNTGLRSLAMAVLILALVRGLVDTDRFELCFPLWLVTMLSIALASPAVPAISS
jgi:exopolysaccharide production protein ExoQ